jgi:hypothetical protein
MAGKSEMALSASFCFASFLVPEVPAVECVDFLHQERKSAPEVLPKIAPKLVRIANPL